MCWNESDTHTTYSAAWHSHLQCLCLLYHYSAAWHSHLQCLCLQGPLSGPVQGIHQGLLQRQQDRDLLRLAQHRLKERGRMGGPEGGGGWRWEGKGGGEGKREREREGVREREREGRGRGRGREKFVEQCLETITHNTNFAANHTVTPCI